MKKNQLLVLVAIAAVAAIAAAVVGRFNAPSSPGATGVGERLLPNFPVNEVARIHLKSADSEAVIARGEDAWAVDNRHGYPANFEVIRSFLQSVWEMTTAQSVTAGAEQFPRLGLAKPGEAESAEGAGTLVEFLSNDGAELAWMVLGKDIVPDTANPRAAMMGGAGGRYVTTSSSPGRVWVIGDTLAQADPNPAQWLDKSFFSVGAPRELAVTGPEGEERWKAERVEESADMQIVPSSKSEDYDENTVRALNRILSSPLLNDVAGKDVPPEISGLDKPVTAEISTFDGFVYKIFIGAEGKDNTRYLKFEVDADLPAERTAADGEKPEDKERLDKEFADKRKEQKDKLKTEQALSEWVFTVPEYNVETLLNVREDFFKKEEEEDEGAATPESGAS